MFQTCCFQSALLQKQSFPELNFSKVISFQSCSFPNLSLSKLRHDAPYGWNCLSALKDCPSSFSARPTDDLLSSIFVVNYSLYYDITP